MGYFCDLLESEVLKVKKLDPRAVVPSKREEDSGYDIYCIIEDLYLSIPSGNNVILNTGISLEFPKGLGFIIGNRGSVGSKCAIVGAHVVDSGYRGEIKIDMHNISDRYIFITDLSLDELWDKVRDELRLKNNEDLIYDIFRKSPIIIPKSKALTQGMIIPTLHLPVIEVDDLSSSSRGSGSFGSTNNI